ncbi:MAG: hypothetical protein IT168_31115 [Bryobacterales bacterium]|nr:hypothetical protein [Bryobacterales bacterium]
MTAFSWRKVTGNGRDAESAATDPEHEAERVIHSLNQRIAQLEAELSRREQQAREQGQKAGYQAGRKEGEAAVQKQATEEMQKTVGKIAETTRDLLGWRKQIRAQMEEDLVHLAVAIARRILHRELTVDEGALLGIIHVALTKIELRELSQIRVSAKDRQIVADRLAAASLPTRVEIVGDPTLARGSLVFETTRGNLDCSIEAQLQEIDRGLADVVRRAQ